MLLTIKWLYILAPTHASCLRTCTRCAAQDPPHSVQKAHEVAKWHRNKLDTCMLHSASARDPHCALNLAHITVAQPLLLGAPTLQYR